jgi:2-polyprenyl-3-methyl-5-hydroxy-6-metoxy-1,4-benzoquinol methylase
VDPEYARRYRNLYNHHWWWRAREEVILETLRSRKPPGGWPHILDVGCGGGVFFDRLAEFGDVEGVEPDEQLVDDSPEIRKRIYVGPFDDRYRPAHRFDLILMMDVVEHLDDPAGALRHALALLAPGGMILITVPAFELLWTTHDDINQHRTRYTKATMRALAAASGLRIDRMRYFFHWTFPAKVAQRMVQAVTRPAPAPASVPPGRINAILYATSRLEHTVFGGLDLPFGSSLMVVGGRSAD